MTRSEKKKRYDGMLIFVVLLLVAAGLVILYSTSAYNGQVKFRSVSLFEKAGVCDTARTVWYGAYRPR